MTVEEYDRPSSQRYDLIEGELDCPPCGRQLAVKITFGLAGLLKTTT